MDMSGKNGAHHLTLEIDVFSHKLNISKFQVYMRIRIHFAEYVSTEFPFVQSDDGCLQKRPRD